MLSIDAIPNRHHLEGPERPAPTLSTLGVEREGHDHAIQPVTALPGDVAR